MKYTPPIGGAANDPYVDANPATGVEGSPVPAAAIEHPQREIEAVISGAGLTPDVGDLTQLQQAIKRMIEGGDYKASVRVATTANIALTGEQTIDGVAVVAGDRVLVKDQTAAAENGIYVAAAGAWARSEDANSAGDLTSGAIVPVENGTLNADTIWMLTTDGAITIGTTALTFGRKDSGSAAGQSVQGAFKNLRASATGTNSTVTVSVDEIVVASAGNAYQTLRGVALAINSAAVGANGLDAGVLAASTWYSVWVIGDGTTTAGLLSLSETAPTLPSGYTHKARVGWIRTDGTANKYPLGFKQSGRRVQYVVASGSNVPTLPAMASGSAGSISTPTWVAVSTSAFVPPTASVIGITGQQLQSSGNGMIAAPNNNYGGFASTTNTPTITLSGGAAVQLSASAFMVLESANIYWASAGCYLLCNGWEDNL